MMNEMIMKKVFEQQGGIEILKQQAYTERRNIEKTNELLAAQGIDIEIPVPGEEERAQQLKRALFALQGDRLAEFAAKEWARAKGADPDSVGPYVDLSAEQWNSKQQKIYQTYRDDENYDIDDPEEAAQTFVFEVFNADLEEFKNEVVQWDTEKKKERLSQVFGGQDPTREPLVFVGHDTANMAKDRLIDELA